MRTNEAFREMVKGLRKDLTTEQYKAIILVRSDLDELMFIKTFYKEDYQKMMKKKDEYSNALAFLERNRSEEDIKG